MRHSPAEADTAAEPSATESRGPDAQRSRVYDAEHFVHRVFDRSADYPILEIAGSHLTLPPERRFADLRSVQAYADAVLRLSWVQARWPRAAIPVTVRERRGGTAAHYEWTTAEIAVPGVRRGDRWALRELVLLHELAHHLRGNAGAKHGPEFAQILLELVDGTLGPEAAFVLRVAYADRNVSCSTTG